jgi:hypothetical protein
LSFQTSLPKIYDISATDASVRRRGVAYLKQNIQMLRDMGGKMLSGVIYAAWGDTPEGPDQDRQYYLDNSVGSMNV